MRIVLPPNFCETAKRFPEWVLFPVKEPEYKIRRDPENWKDPGYDHTADYPSRLFFDCRKREGPS